MAIIFNFLGNYTAFRNCYENSNNLYIRNVTSFLLTFLRDLVICRIDLQGVMYYHTISSVIWNVLNSILLILNGYYISISKALRSWIQTK